MSTVEGQGAPTAAAAVLRPPRRRIIAKVLARSLIWCARVAALACGLVLVAGVAVGVRLAVAPADVTGLARWWEGQRVAGARLAQQRATLWWNVRAAQSPLVLRLQGAVVSGPDRVVRADAAELSVGVLPGRLVIGRLRPVWIVVQRGSMALHRVPAGGWALDGLAEPVHGASALWRRLQSVHLAELTLRLTDQSLPGPLRLSVTRLDAQALDRAAGLNGMADLTLRLSGQSSHVMGALTAVQGSRRVLSAAWSAVDPALLRLDRLNRAFAALDVPLAGSVRAELGRDGRLIGGTALLRLGAGTIAMAGGTVPVASAALRIDGADRRATLSGLRLTLADPRGRAGPGPVVTGGGRATWTGLGAEVALALDIDRLQLGTIGLYWPAGLAPDARRWVGTNVIAGIATGGHFDLGFSLDGDARPSLTAAGGRVTAHDVTLAWLSRVPPLVHAAATLTLLSPDALSITLQGATQSPSDPASSALTLQRGSLRITGLSGPVQTAAAEADLSGTVAQAIALLREPRLHLLASHPLEFGMPGGTLRGHLAVRLPLTARIGSADLMLRANAEFSALHLGGVIGGKDLDGGEMRLQADTSGLHMAGTARLAGIASNLTVAMDFSTGAADQVVTSYHASGTATVAELQASGLLTAGLMGGGLAYDAVVLERRDGSGRAQLHADLRQAALSLKMLGWRKPPGTDTTVDALLLLARDRVVGVDQLAVAGPGVDVRARAIYGAGQPVSLVFDSIVLGATRAAGTLRFAAAADPRLHLTMRGSLLDLSHRGGAEAAPGAGPAASTPSRTDARAAARVRRVRAAAQTGQGQAWQADVHFDRVQLGSARDLIDVDLSAQSDGRLVRAANASGRSGAGGFHITLAPEGSGRVVHGVAQDAGDLLTALDWTTAVHGGTLVLDARFDDGLTDHPLTGTATIDGFQVIGAPAMARLLQAMTLYGVVDLLHGPGLGFSHLIAPFRLADNVLTLEGARAFSGSLGLTAKGEVDLTAQRADLSGTIVPAYFFNALLGRVPVLGKLFSPEQGGGLFAATYSVSGAIAAPYVHVNPLAALTPGFLRGVFGILDPAVPDPVAIKPPAAAPAAAPVLGIPAASAGTLDRG